MWVKICGVRTPEAARAAVDAGADAVGLVFAPSPRRLEPEAASAVAAAVPETVERVGVFVDAPLAEILHVARRVPLTAVQLSGDEPPSLVRELAERGWKVIRAVGGVEDVDPGLPVWAWLLDHREGRVRGGSGRRADWEAGRVLAQQVRLILAGGLTPGNVEEAIRAVRPFGVDVSSGVETEGQKDPEKIRRFVQKARAVR